MQIAAQYDAAFERAAGYGVAVRLYRDVQDQRRLIWHDPATPPDAHAQRRQRVRQGGAVRVQLPAERLRQPDRRATAAA